MAERVRKKDSKKCGVCGDNALGSNFNAITCESCKAFFRRNALKTKEFKCPFDNNCKVDLITRRFCQKCRLKKCFTIGMKKEWIMSDEEKKAKRDKIEKNRQKRSIQSGFIVHSSPVKTEFTCVKSEASDDSQTLLSPLSSMSPLTPQTPGSAGVIADLPKGRASVHQPLTPSDSEYSPSMKIVSASESIAEECLSNDDSQTLDISIVSDARSESELSIDMPGENSSCSFSKKGNNEEGKELLLVPKVNHTDAPEILSYSVYTKAIEIEFTELPIRSTIMASKELNTIENMKLQELISANEVLKMPLICGVSDPSLLDVINMTDHAIRRLIKMSKRITAFKNLCQDDQIALLKGGCTEMMILRSVMSYDPEKECWQGPKGPNVMSIKVDILKEAKGNLYEEHKRFLNSFHPQWRADENIMLILCGIALFTPERPNTVHKEAIKLEQDTYYYLLRRYLTSVYAWCEANSVYMKLIHQIHELHTLNDEIVRVYLDVNPKDVEPLLIEIFDLKH